MYMKEILLKSVGLTSEQAQIGSGCDSSAVIEMAVVNLCWILPFSQKIGSMNYVPLCTAGNWRPLNILYYFILCIKEML